MPRFHRISLIKGVAAVVLGLVPLGACSSDDDEGSKVQPPPGGTSARGGSAGVLGASGASGASGNVGASGASGATGSSGSSTGGSSGSGGSATACRGLPIDIGGAGGTGPTDGGADSSPPDASGGSAGAAGGSGGTGGVCAGSAQEVERIDVDLLFVMDRSISMGEQVPGGQTRWEALRAAMDQLAQAPSAAALQAGLVFYSISGAANDSVDCNAASYATPTVAIGPLADVGDDMVAAIAGRSPGGLTPILPAMEGALTYARQWAQAHPDRAAAIVLVSDSYPTQCSNDPTEVAATAQAAYSGTPSIRTFVIGVGANTGAKFNLDNFARSGGTGTPFMVDDGNITEVFVDTILNIAQSNLACDFSIPAPPPGTTLNFEQVQVIYTPGSTGDPEEVPRVNSASECGRAVNGGWYYDNPTAPTRIYTCPCTCARFGAGRVDVRYGCRPRFG